MTTLNNHRHSTVYILFIAAVLKGDATVGSGKLTEVKMCVGVSIFYFYLGHFPDRVIVLG